MALEAERIYPHCSTVIRIVPIGGLTKEALLAQLQRNAILLNEAAEGLSASPHFTTAATPHTCTTVELTVRDLGFPHGALTATLYSKAAALGLGLCPLELGPISACTIWLSLKDIGCSPCANTKAPSGSITIATITIASVPLTSVT